MREGFCADVVIFDPNDFDDRATYADPHQFPTGARTSVIVNGTLVVENAQPHRRATGQSAAPRRQRGGKLNSRNDYPLIAAGRAALGFPMAGALIARRAADPGAGAVIAR